MSSEPAFPRDLLSPLGSSGFPFQTAVAALLRSGGSFEVEEEVAWQDGDGSHKFLDTVASLPSARVCIECKALRTEKLVFLLPKDARDSQTQQVHAIHLSYLATLRKPTVIYAQSNVGPSSHESAYCVMLGKSAGESRLIEREAQPLVRGAEQYAKDRWFDFAPSQAEAQNVVCLPVLVTTANLFVAAYDPREISLTDGIYRARDEHIRPVHLIRFTKQFTANGPERMRSRTVIIVQADHLKDLVNGILNNPSIATSGERLRDLAVP